MATCDTDGCENPTGIGMKYCDDCTLTRDDYWTLYVLELQDACYYVGITTAPEKRLKEHTSGKKPVDWTEQHKPIGVAEVREEIADASEMGEAQQIEREVTLEYMREKGWKRVRGGPWCRPEMDSPPWE